jgi:hypothetical protein
MEKIIKMLEENSLVQKIAMGAAMATCIMCVVLCGAFLLLSLLHSVWWIVCAFVFGVLAGVAFGFFSWVEEES